MTLLKQLKDKQGENAKRSRRGRENHVVEVEREKKKLVLGMLFALFEHLFGGSWRFDIGEFAAH